MQSLLDNLKKRGFKSYFAQSGEEAKQIIENNIPYKSIIGFGGSMTVQTLGLAVKLKESGYVCNHTSSSTLDWETQCKQNRDVDYYVTSSNAITKDGILVNMDGRANRVAAMCYGPKKLFFVIGKNKICENLESAIKRIETVAAPLNAKRLNRNTPCVKTGYCTKCNSPDTICKALLVLYHPTSTMEVHVIIINEELGF